MRWRMSLTLRVAMRIACYDEFVPRAAASATSCVTVSQVRESISNRRRREGTDLRDLLDRFLAAGRGGVISRSGWRGLGMRTHDALAVSGCRLLRLPGEQRSVNFRAKNSPGPKSRGLKSTKMGGGDNRAPSDGAQESVRALNGRSHASNVPFDARRQ